jgi:hypothetical protein
MTSPSSGLAPLVGRDRAEYGVIRIRDQAFDAVQRLWRKRRDAGVTQKALADIIKRDPGWVSKNLRAPGNWTLRTIGELVQALNGEVEIKVVGIEEPMEQPSNFDAYDEYRPRQNVIGTTGFVGTISVENPMAVNFAINQVESYEIALSAPMLNTQA